MGAFINLNKAAEPDNATSGNLAPTPCSQGLPSRTLGVGAVRKPVVVAESFKGTGAGGRVAGGSKG